MLIAIFTSVGVAACVAQLVVAYRDQRPWYLVAPIVIALAIWGFRAARSGVLVDDRGVVVRNPFRSVTLAWSDIVEFRMAWSGIRTYGAQVVLRDGSRVKAFGIQGPNPRIRPKSKDAERIVAELNEELRAHGEGTP
jgi:hypothetical protein